jgi:hypothetical protein
MIVIAVAVILIGTVGFVAYTLQSGTACSITGEPFGIVLRVISDSGSPIPGVEVAGESVAYCNGQQQTNQLPSSTTNSSGWVSFLEGYPGNYQLTLSYLGQRYDVTVPTTPTDATYATYAIPSGNPTTSFCFANRNCLGSATQTSQSSVQTTSSTVSASGLQPSVLWSKTMSFASAITIYSQDDDGIGPVAVSQNDSEIVVGTGQAIGNGSIYAFNDKGASLWNYTLNQFVSSISMSANASLIAVGGVEVAQGPAGVYENGAVYLLNGQGKLLWSERLGGSGPSVKLSSDGSRLAVATETDVLYMNDRGQTLWSFDSGNSGNIMGMDMSPSGDNVIASVMYRPNTENWSWSFLSFNGGGSILWNYTEVSPGGVSFADRVVLASDGLHTWASSAVSGENGTLYLFDNNGTLLWSRQIYSPALIIQTARTSQDVTVLTNWSTLVFNEQGQQLANYTASQQSVASAGGSSCASSSFWVSNLGSLNVLFLNGQGAPLSSYPLNRTVSNAVVSADGHYAAIISNQDNRSILYFMDLAESASDCAPT